MSNVNLHTDMRTNTFNKIFKAFITASLFILTAFSSINAAAQTVYNVNATGSENSFGAYCSSINAASIIDNYAVIGSCTNGTIPPLNNSTYRKFIGAAIYKVDASSGAASFLDSVSMTNYGYSGSSPAGLIGHSSGHLINYRYANANWYFGATQTANRITNTANAVLRYLTVYASAQECRDYDLYGNTLMVSLHFASSVLVTTSTEVINIYFDIVGAPGQMFELIDKSTESYYDQGGWGSLSVSPTSCDGDIELVLGNDVNLYSNSKTYLGNIYSATCDWDRISDSWGKADETVAKGADRVKVDITDKNYSGSVSYSPKYTVTVNDKDFKCNIIFDKSWNVYYFTNIQVQSNFQNETSGAFATKVNTFTACYHDDVTYTPTFIQNFGQGLDEEVPDNAIWSLYRVDNNTNAVKETIFENQPSNVVKSYTFSHVEYDERYKVVAQYTDVMYDEISGTWDWTTDINATGGHARGYLDMVGAVVSQDDFDPIAMDYFTTPKPNNCKTEVYFDILVKQVDAQAYIEFEDGNGGLGFCEGSPATIKATIDPLAHGSQPEDYAYRWSVCRGEYDKGQPVFSKIEGVPYDWVVSGDEGYNAATSTGSDLFVEIKDPNTVDHDAYKIIYKFEYANTYQIGSLRFYCPMETVDEAIVLQVPDFMEDDLVLKACENQPFSFDIEMSLRWKNQIVNNRDCSFNIYSDPQCTVVSDKIFFSKLANPCEPDNSNLNEANRASITSWVCPDGLTDSCTVFCKVVNNQTHCESRALPIKIHIIPSPNIETVSSVDNIYCLHSDVSALEATAELAKKYVDYPWTEAGLTQPKVTYHWTWKDAAGVYSDSKDVTDDNKLSGVFAGQEISQYVGNAEISVFATDEYGCGYKLDCYGVPVSGENNFQTPQVTLVEIVDRPQYGFEDKKEFCSSEQIANINFKVNDGRTLTFNFTQSPSDNVILTPGTDFPSVLTIDGNSNQDFTVKFNSASISDITSFNFNINVVETYGARSCEHDTTMTFYVHDNPVITDVVEWNVCEGQPFSFNCKVNPATITAEGHIKAELFTDPLCTTLASTLGFYDMSDANTKADGFNTDNANTTFWWGKDVAEYGVYTLYIRLTNTVTNCVSDVEPISIRVIPAPVLSKVTPTPDAYCLHDDDKDLVVSVVTSSDYVSYDWSTYPGEKPSLTYHWTWYDPNNEVIASKDITVNNSQVAAISELKGVFGDGAITRIPGNVKFEVYATTDKMGCGYELNHDQSIKEPKVVALAKADNVVTINTLPDYTIKTQNVCGSEEQSYFDIASNDSRDLVVRIDKVGATPACVYETTEVDVPAGAPYRFNISFDESVVKGDQKFDFNFYIKEKNGLNCVHDTSYSFIAYELPLLNNIDPVYVCANQKVQFKSQFSKNITADLEYHLFNDKAMTSEYTGSFITIKPQAAPNTDVVLYDVDYDFFSGLKPGQIKEIYVSARDTRTGCYAHPVKVEFRILPVPYVGSISVSPYADLCLNEDPSDINFTAVLESDYSSFDFTTWFGKAPEVTYHWSATNANGDVVRDLYDTKVQPFVLDLESDKSFSDYQGQSKVTVWATDDLGCGYVMDYDGTVLKNGSEDQHAQTAVETFVNIHSKPGYTVDESVWTCADARDVAIDIKSSDTRALSFSFESLGAAPAPKVTLITIAANGSGALETRIPTPDAISEITTYSYKATINYDATGSLSCEYIDTISFDAYPQPIVELVTKSEDLFVCQDADRILTVKDRFQDGGFSPVNSNFSNIWSVDGVVDGSSNGLSFTYSPAISEAIGNKAIKSVVAYTFDASKVCYDTIDFNLFVDPLVTYTAAATKDEICEGEQTDIVVTVTNADAANHFNPIKENAFEVPSLAAVSVANNVAANVLTYTVEPTISTTYTVDPVNTVTGCVANPVTFDVLVNVNRKGHIKLGAPSPKEVCAGSVSIEIPYSVVNPTEFDAIDFSSITLDALTCVAHTESSLTMQGILNANPDGTSKTITLGKTVCGKTTDGCELVADNSITVKVNPIPAAPAFSATNSGITSDIEVCRGANQTLVYNVVVTKGYKYEWFISPTQPVGDELLNPIKVTTATSPAYTFNARTIESSTRVWVRAVDANNSATNCPSEFNSLAITVHQLPVLDLDPVKPVCEGEQAIISIAAPLSTATTAYTYNFFDAKGNLLSSIDGSTIVGTKPEFTTAALTANTLFYISVVNQVTTCESNTISVTAQVNPKPVGSGKVAYADAYGNSTFQDPNGQTHKLSAFCFNNEGLATVFLDAQMAITGDSFVSDLVAVSDGDLASWIKQSEDTWICTKTWTTPVTLTFTVEDSNCKSEEFNVTIDVLDELVKPVLQLTAGNIICANSDNESFTLDFSPYVNAGTDMRYLIEARNITSSIWNQVEVVSSLTATYTYGNLMKKCPDINYNSNIEFRIVAYNQKTGCQSPYSDVVVNTINQLPVPTITTSVDINGRVVCPGEEVTLYGEAGYVSYLWPDETTGASTLQDVKVYPTTTTTYHLIVVDANGCESAPAEVTITVRPKPKFNLMATPDVVCQNSDEEVIIVPTHTNGPGTSDNITLAEPYNFYTVGTSTAVVTAEPNGDSYIYKIKGHKWTEASVTFAATVYSSIQDNHCLSDEKTVTVTVVAALPQPDINSTSPQDSSVTKDVHVCTGSTDPITITVDNLADYNSMGGTVNYTTHWFTDAACTNEILSDAVYTVSNDKLTFVPSTNIQIFAKIRREVAPNCESEVSIPVVITIEDLPLAPVALDPSDKYICLPEEAANFIDLTVQNPADDNHYYWYVQSEGEFDDNMDDDVMVGDAVGMKPATIAVPSKTTYYYARTLSKYGCLSSGKSNVVKVLVNSNPEIIEVLKPKADICSGEQINMEVDVTSESKEGISYVYTITSSNPVRPVINGEVVDGKLTLNPTVTESEQWTISFRARYGGVNGCLSLTSVDYVVNVHAAPEVTNIFANPNPVCEYSDVDITVKVVSHDQYFFEGGSRKVNISLSDASDVLFQDNGVEISSGINKVYTVSAIKRGKLPITFTVDENGCSTSVDAGVQINDIPDFNIIAEGKTNNQTDPAAMPIYDFCDMDNMTLKLENTLPAFDNNGNPTSYTFQWYLDDAPLMGEVSSEYSYLILSPSQSGIYKLVVENAGCSFSKEVEVVVHDLPLPEILQGNELNTYCTDDTLTLSSRYEFASYEWNVLLAPGDVQIDGTERELKFPLSDLTLDVNLPLEVELSVVDEFGCASASPAIHNAWLSNPPVIDNVYGTETCSENPFYITVKQDKADYLLRLYDANGVALTDADYTFDAINKKITTSNNLPDGTYIIEVVELDGGIESCNQTKQIQLNRYQIEPTIILTDDYQYFCENEALTYNVHFSDVNGHADFMDKIGNSFDVTIGYYDADDNLLFEATPETLTSVDKTITFVPEDLSATAPHLVPSATPYAIKVSVKYKFSGDSEGDLDCNSVKEQDIYIVSKPKLTTDPVMPICLETPVQFIVSTVEVTAANPAYYFYKNGVLINEGNTESNVLNSVDYPFLVLNEGDVITAKVVMNDQNTLCTSEPITITYHADIFPTLEMPTADIKCLGTPFDWTIKSTVPAGADPTFVAPDIKSIELHIVDNGTDNVVLTADQDPAAVEKTVISGNIAYEGSNDEIQYYAVVEDPFGCTRSTDPVTIRVHQVRVVDIEVYYNGVNVDYLGNDLCADVDYVYKAILKDNKGNIIEPNNDYDFTFGTDDWEWNAHVAPNYYLNDTIVYQNVVSKVENKVKYIYLPSGCVSSDVAGSLYETYSEEFNYHARPEPNESLVEPYVPVASADPLMERHYMICNDDQFTFGVDGSDITVLFDGVPSVKFTSDGGKTILDESTLTDGQVTANFDKTATPVHAEIAFDILPSSDYHTVQFMVSDGACEVLSKVWSFRKRHAIDIEALLGAVPGLDINQNGVATICYGEFVKFVPSTEDGTYTKGYNFILNDELKGADDFSQADFTFLPDSVGTYELIVKADFGENNCQEKITLIVNPAPDPNVVLEANGSLITDDSHVAGSLSWNFQQCENTPTTIRLTGANDYIITSVKRDGVDVSADFTLNGSDVFDQNVEFHYDVTTAAGDLSLYEFEFTAMVGNCFKQGTFTVAVPNKPEAEFINNTPLPLVIAGTEVPVDVTAGYADYAFYVNDSLIYQGPASSVDGVDNVLTKTSEIKVVVTNTYGCDTTLIAKVTVLDNIEPKDITVSSDFYCSEDEGVTLTVVDPQPMVSYRVVGRNDFADIFCPGEDAEVFWEPVRVADVAVANPEEFKVVAFYDQLPTQTFPMNNSVWVEEVASPVDAYLEDLLVTDCSVAQDPAFSWTINGADPTNYYYLLHDGVEVYGPVTSTGSTLALNINEIMTLVSGAVDNGTYTVVARTKRQNGDFVCEKTLSGKLVVDMPTTEKFDVTVNPADGNYCVDDPLGVDITVSGSDFSSLYDHEYILYENGVKVASKISDATRGPIVFEKVVSSTTTPGQYIYNVVCAFNGCLQPMNNTVVVNAIARPNIYDITVNDEGYYCYDEDGVTITVSGQDSTALYTLYLNGVSTGITHQGDASGAPFTFDNVKEEGVYTVIASTPWLSRTGCDSEMNGSVKVKEILEPTTPVASIQKVGDLGWGTTELEICLDDEANVFLRQPDVDNSTPRTYDVTYELYDQDGLVATSPNLANLPSYISFDNIKYTVPGDYIFSIKAIKTYYLPSGATKQCEKMFDDALKLTYIVRPNGGETLNLDLNPNPADPCYGANIEILNANLTNPKQVYYLYLLGDDGVSLSRVDSICPAQGDAPIFADIRNSDGHYYVYAFNGACQDLIGDVHVQLDKYAKVQLLEIADNMCQGDPGVDAGLMDSEMNVEYILYYIEPGYTGSFKQSDLSENTPGTPLSSFITTYDHERVYFKDIDYADGRTPISDLVSKDGYYYVTARKTTVTNACPVASPVVNFQTLKLPKSYRLMRSQIYCDDAEEPILFLESSEDDPVNKITYLLYSKDAAGNLTYIDEILSTGADSLAFNVKVSVGTYVAIAVKEYASNGHICTSSLEGEVVIEKSQPIQFTYQDLDVVACNNNPATVTLPAVSLQADVLYYVTDEETSPERGFITSALYDGKGDLTLSGLKNGLNIIWASYENFDCLVEIGRANVVRNPALKANIVNTVACGGEFQMEPTDVVLGATYELSDINSGAVVGTVSPVVGDQLVSWTNVPQGQYKIVAYFGAARDCETEIGLVDFKPTIETIVVPETIVACSPSLGEYDLTGLHADMLIDGATYYLVDAETSPITSKAFGFNYTAGDAVVFSGLKPGNYRLYASFENYSCLTPIVDVNVISSDVNNYDLTAVRECNDMVTFTLAGSDLNVNYELWVINNDKSENAVAGVASLDGTGDALVFDSFAYDANAARYFVKATAGTCPPVNIGLVYGFSLKAEFNLTAANFSTNGSSLCSGEDLELRLDASDAGVNYYLTLNNETAPIPGSEKVGDGNALIWNNLPKYEGIQVFHLHAYKDNCSSDSWPEVVVDFNATTVPEGELTVYIQGKAYTSKSTDIPTVCPGTNIIISAMVSGANVKTYYFMRRLPSADDFEEGLVSGANSYIPYQPEETDINGEITVRLDVETYGGCKFDGLDSIKFTLQNDLAGEKHLVARNDILDYCEGEFGVKLGYVNSAEKGAIYRLYKVNDQQVYDDLVDIQEIPSYVDNFLPTDTLFFNGWGQNVNDGNYASAGTYYVIMQNMEGCQLRTDEVVVAESPSPAAREDSVYYVFVDADGSIDKATANTEYGVLGGSVVYTTAVPGNTYYLMKDDTVLVTSATVNEPCDLVFGPIKEITIDDQGNESITFEYDAYGNISAINCGEGTYSVLVKSGVEPYCEQAVGNVTFVAEELVAYNVEIYLNQGEAAIVKDLVPKYDFDTHVPYKGNHMYIDWSTKIDRVYKPIVIAGEDGYYLTDVTETSSINPSDDPDYFKKGYTNVPGTYNSNTHKYTGKSGSSNVWFQLVNDPDVKISGSYGLINPDYSQGGDSSVISMCTPSGLFYYMKQPSFYGKEVIKYYIENKQMPGRVSNIATITILCGNEATGDSSSVFLIPNAFSPNGDGLNDQFKIIIPDKYQDNSESKLLVYNRWGTLVYRSSGLRYGENEEWWDGTSSTSNMVTLGSNLPSGTYYYVFTITFIDKQHATKSERKMHGYVELRR